MHANDHVCKNWVYMVRVTLFPVQRYKIRDVELLRRILNFIDDSVGSTISAKRIADYFRSQARSVDMNTVYPYLDALASSFLITRVQRYDIQGKKLL